MKHTHLDRVRDLAFLKWELATNESAKADGLITTAMYEFARDALKKDIAFLEKLCYNSNQNGGDTSGIKTDPKSA